MAKLELLVDVTTRGARGLEGISDRLGRVGRNLTLGVTTPLIAAGGAAVALAADAERSGARLESVFGSMEAAAWTTVDALQAQQQALQDATTFDDEAIADAQAAMLTFGEVTGEAFERSIEASADLAAFFETDMEDAALQLGKALNDPVGGLSRLSRMGVSFTEEQEEMVAALVASGDVAAAQGIILDEVGRQVGNVAEDLAATTGGQMQQAMNQLANAGEAIGAFLLPVLTQLAQWLQGAAKWFQDLGPGMQGFIVGLAAIAAAVGPLLLVLSSLASGFGVVTAALNVMKLALLTNPFTALAVAAAALAALIILNWDKIVLSFQNLWRDIQNTMTAIEKVIKDVWNGIMRFLGQVGENIEAIGRTIWMPIGKGFDAVIDFIKGVWNGFARFWNGIQISVPSVDVPFVGKFGGFTIGVPDLPMLAEGGIVTAPTLALIGERGPEAVVPLDGQHGMGGINIEVNVLGDLRAETPEEVASAIGRALWSSGITDQTVFGGTG